MENKAERIYQRFSDKARTYGSGGGLLFPWEIAFQVLAAAQAADLALVGAEGMQILEPLIKANIEWVFILPDTIKREPWNCFVQASNKAGQHFMCNLSHLKLHFEFFHLAENEFKRLSKPCKRTNAKQS